MIKKIVVFSIGIAVVSCLAKKSKNYCQNVLDHRFTANIWNNSGVQLVFDSSVVMYQISPQCNLEFDIAKFENDFILLSNSYNIDCSIGTVSSFIDSTFSRFVNKNFATILIINDSTLKIEYTNQDLVNNLNELNYYADTIFPSTFSSVSY